MTSDQSLIPTLTNAQSMELLPGIKKLAFVDPKIDVSKQPTYVFRAGSSQIAYNNYPSNSNSNINQSFNIPVSSLETIVDREIKQLNPINIKFQGVINNGMTGTLINIGSQDALRRFPIQRQLSNLTLSVNSSNITTSPNLYMAAFSEYQKRDLEQTELSTAPSMKDAYAEYNQYISRGAVRNSLGDYGDNGYEVPRGAYTPDVIDYNNSTGASLNFNFLQESLMISPLTYNFPAADKGLAAISNLQVVETFQNNPQMIWSHASGTGSISTLTNVTWSYNQVPTVVTNFLAPNNAFAPFDARKPLYYDMISYYYQTALYATPVTPLATFQPTSAVFQINSLPRCMMIFVAEQLSSQTVISSDTFAWIKSINCSFGNMNNILANANPQELFLLSRANGYQGSWQRWSQFVGSPLVLQMGKDVPLENNETASMAGKYQFQVTSSTCQSLYPTRTVTFNMVVVALLEGVLTVTGGEAQVANGVITQEDILSAATLPRVDAHSLMVGAGGNIFDSIRGFFNHSVPGIFRKAVEYAPKIFDVARKVIPVVNQLGGPAAQRYTAPVSSILGSGGRSRRHRRMRGGNLDTCEEKGECGHQSCEGPEGGCAECDGVGRIKNSDLRSKMMGSGGNLVSSYQPEYEEVIEYV